MSENPNEKNEYLESPELDEVASLSNEYAKLFKQKRDLRYEKHDVKMEKLEKIHHRVEAIKVRLTYLLTNLLINNHELAKEIVEELDMLLDEKPNYNEQTVKGAIAQLLTKKKIKDGANEGIKLPQEHEHHLHTDYQRSLEFLERRKRMIAQLVKNGYEEFEEYLQYIKDSISKLKFRTSTFYIGKEQEESNFHGRGVQDIWNELIIYLTQKSAGEIGGIERVQGEHRVRTELMGEKEGNFYDSIRVGSQIVEEVVTEGFKYDYRTISFISVLERDIEMGSGQMMHYHRLGRWSRRRYTEAMCREAQSMYRPAIQKHNQTVAEMVKLTLNQQGNNLLPEVDPEFGEKLETIMEIYPQYHYLDAELGTEEEEIIEDPRGVKIAGKIEYDEVPIGSYNNDKVSNEELSGIPEDSDYTLYEDPRVNERDQT